MKFIITLIILSILSIINSQNTTTELYANFVPYFDNSCSSTSIGIGYSIAVNGECIKEIIMGFSEFNPVLTYNPNNEEISVSFYEDQERCRQQYLNRTYVIGINTCIPTPPFTGMLGNFEFNGQSSVGQYSYVTISKEPVFAPNSVVYSYYYPSTSTPCSNDSFMSAVSFTVDLNMSSPMISQTYSCDQGVAYLESCADTQCTNNDISCECNQEMQNTIIFCNQ